MALLESHLEPWDSAQTSVPLTYSAGHMITSFSPFPTISSLVRLANVSSNTENLTEKAHLDKD